MYKFFFKWNMFLYVKEKLNVFYMVIYFFSFGLCVINIFGCDRYYRDYINYIYIYMWIFLCLFW